MGLELITAPVDDLNLISLDEAKEHLRVDGDDDDGYVTALITAARQWAEEYTQRSILLTDWKYFRDSFEAEVIPLTASQLFEGTYYPVPNRNR